MSNPIYVLTSGVDYEGETLVFVSDNLDAVKAAAVQNVQDITHAPDSYNIYEANLNQEPRHLLENVVRGTWKQAKYESHLTTWETA